MKRFWILFALVASMAMMVNAQDIQVGPVNNLRVEKVYYNNDPFMDPYRIVWTWDRAWIPPSGSDQVYYIVWDEDGDQINAAEVGYFAETWDQGADYVSSVDIAYTSRVPFSPGEQHAICVQACYSKDGEVYYGPKSELVWAKISTTTDVKGVQPENHFIVNNYPNPFNPTTTIQYSLSKMSDVRLMIYNSLGQKVIDLVNEVQSPGIYRITWDASNQSTGTYLYQLKANGVVSKIGRMQLMK